MAEGAGAAVHVDLVVRQAVLLHRRHGDDRERLVDLVEIDLARAPAGALEELGDGADRGGGEPARFLGMRRMPGHQRKRGEAAPLGSGAPHQDQRRGAVGDRARIGRGHRAVLAERGLQGRDLLEVSLEGLLVGLDELLFLAGLDRERRGLPRKPAFLVGFLRSLKGANGELVLGLPRKGVFLRAILGEAPHQAPLVVRILESVVEHVVDHLPVTHAQTRARLGK